MRTILLIVIWLLQYATSLHADVLSKSEIKTLQSSLNQLGYNAGVPDGVAGRKTTAALNAFFTFENQLYDGVLSKNEVIAIKNVWKV